MSDTERGLAMPEERGAREVLTDVGQRLPRYAQLAARLAQDTRLAGSQRAPLAGLLGSNFPVLNFLPGLLPVVGRFSGLLGMFSTVTFALAQLEPEVAEQHLLAVGLSRAQVEADLRDTTALARRLAAPVAGPAGQVASATSARQAGRLVGDLSQHGMRRAGRLFGRGLRAVRDHAAQAKPPSGPASDAG